MKQYIINLKNNQTYTQQLKDSDPTTVEKVDFSTVLGGYPSEDSSNALVTIGGGTTQENGKNLAWFDWEGVLHAKNFKTTDNSAIGDSTKLTFFTLANKEEFTPTEESRVLFSQSINATSEGNILTFFSIPFELTDDAIVNFVIIFGTDTTTYSAYYTKGEHIFTLPYYNEIKTSGTSATLKCNISTSAPDEVIRIEQAKMKAIWEYLSSTDEDKILPAESQLEVSKEPGVLTIQANSAKMITITDVAIAEQ